MTAAPSVRAITVRPPWTLPILAGFKGTENRRQPTRWRGLLAIHVSRTRCEVGDADPRVQRVRAAYRATRAARLADAYGCVVAVADLVDCHPDAGCCAPWGDPDAFHLTLHGVRLLPRPIPTRGALGVWTPPPPIAARLLDLT